MLDFVISLIMIVICFHYHIWQYEFDKVKLIGLFGGATDFCQF
jgi:hypothetical protein